jgi:hypothetical protein
VEFSVKCTKEELDEAMTDDDGPMEMPVVGEVEPKGCPMCDGDIKCTESTAAVVRFVCLTQDCGFSGCIEMDGGPVDVS